MDGDEDATRKLVKLERSGKSRRVSSMTLLELFEGIQMAEKPETEKEKVIGVLENIDVVEADEKVMRRAGKLSGKLMREGNTVGREDCVVASAAIQEDEKVLTRNTEDFKRINSVETERY